MKNVLLASLLMLALSISVTALAVAIEKEAAPSGVKATATDAVKDPVCGMDVAKPGAKYVYEYKGKKHWFCSKDDMDKFKKNPQKYLKMK